VWGMEVNQSGVHHKMKRNVGRPAKEPQTAQVTLTLRVPADFKRLLMSQANAYGMTMTEYLVTLVERDGA
jgi:hypothetical protein